jgi:hypothetical protein
MSILFFGTGVQEINQFCLINRDVRLADTLVLTCFGKPNRFGTAVNLY